MRQKAISRLMEANVWSGAVILKDFISIEYPIYPHPRVMKSGSRLLENNGNKTIQCFFSI